MKSSAPVGLAALARLLPLALVVALEGCVERKLVVKPDPPDALVFVDGVEQPRELRGPLVSPAVLRYEHYGIREVVVRKKGYRAVERRVTLDPPWWQIFPIDLVTDVLVPWTIEDRRELEVPLEPRRDLQDPASGDAVLERARALATQAERHP